MEANAPDNLYVDIRDNLSDSILYGFTEKCTDDDIEYTRTDAFVEKATLWLLTNASGYCILHNSYDTKELVKDFVDAMKRE